MRGRDETGQDRGTGRGWIYHLLVPPALNPLMDPSLHSNISLGKEKKIAWPPSADKIGHTLLTVTLSVVGEEMGCVLALNDVLGT